MAPHLLPCPDCTRHVRVTEGACPFCASVLSEAFRRTPRPARPVARLGRAAIVAFGVGIAAGGAAACGGSSAEPEPVSDPATDPTTGGVTEPDPVDPADPADPAGPVDPPDDDYGGMAPEYGTPE